MSGPVKLLEERKGSVTVSVRMIGQVNEWTNKTVVRTKGIGGFDSENEWTSKTVVRTKGIGDCVSENEWTSKTVERERKRLVTVTVRIFGQVKLLKRRK